MNETILNGRELFNEDKRLIVFKIGVFHILFDFKILAVYLFTLKFKQLLCVPIKITISLKQSIFLLGT